MKKQGALAAAAVALVFALSACTESLSPEAQEIKESMTEAQLALAERQAKREGMTLNEALNDAALQQQIHAEQVEAMQQEAQARRDQRMKDRGFRREGDVWVSDPPDDWDRDSHFGLSSD